MRFYQGQHRFYCGIDLHTRSMHVCVLDQSGEVVFDKSLACRPETLLRALEPFRDGLVIGVECMFAWYWLADLCVEQDIAFVLGHALYLKAIHGAKAKNDRIDAGKLARLLRGGNFPTAYAYPKGMRETRDLLRRRTYLVRKRAELLTHLQILNAQYNLTPFPKRLCYATNREDLNIAERFGDASVNQNAAADLTVVNRLDEVIADLERYLTRTAKIDDVQTYQRLQTIPGVGPLLALILLYETHDVGRFDSAAQFLSYARLVRCLHESAGKKLGTGGKKIGNGHLRWAFAEAACLFLQRSERAKRWKQKQAAQRGSGKALAILAARLARATYHMLRKGEAFDEERFWGGASHPNTENTNTRSSNGASSNGASTTSSRSSIDRGTKGTRRPTTGSSSLCRQPRLSGQEALSRKKTPSRKEVQHAGA
jgi:transposase